MSASPAAPPVEFPGLNEGEIFSFDPGSLLDAYPVLTQEDEAAHAALLYAYGTIGQERISVLRHQTRYNTYHQPYVTYRGEPNDPEYQTLYVPRGIDTPEEGLQSDVLLTACTSAQTVTMNRPGRLQIYWVKAPGYREALADKRIAKNAAFKFRDIEVVREIRVASTTGEVTRLASFDWPHGMLHAGVANAWMKWIAVYGASISAGVVFADMTAPDARRLRSEGIDPLTTLYTGTHVLASYHGRPRMAVVRASTVQVERAFSPVQLVNVGATGYYTGDSCVPLAALREAWVPDSPDDAWNERFVRVLVSAAWFDPRAPADQMVTGVVERASLPKGFDVRLSAG